ncbi:hypothetical protein B0H10DRAFT_735207 [Mycena sp. CBHHK59/15]|nr:hypothetical protein B0H10DRAFT_735207 [Mycena sp. CBHHK59/15]
MSEIVRDKPPCRLFLQGRCRNGDRCRFLHKASDTVPFGSQTIAPTTLTRTVVQRWRTASSPASVTDPSLQQAHPDPVASSSNTDRRPTIPVLRTTEQPMVVPQASPVFSQARPRPKRGELPCRAWRDGNCTKGAKCWYGHDPQVQEARRLRKEQEARAAEQEEARLAELAELAAAHRASLTRQLAERERQETARLARQAEEEAAYRTHQLAERERQETARLARQAEEEAAHRARQLAERERREAARLARQAEEEVRRIELENRKAETARKEAAQTIQHIVLGSSLVTFSAGVAIQEVVAGFDSCRIQIKNLPRDATRDEILALFTQQGVDPTRLFVSGTKRSPNGHLEATLITTSEEGGAIAIGLEDIEFREERLHFEVAENDRSGGMGHSMRNSDTLTLSWRAPSTSVVVTFPSVRDAEAKVKVLNRKLCGGRQVRVQMNQPPPGLMRGNWQSAIKITGLPITISPEDVTHFTGSTVLKFLRPINYDVAEGTRRLRQHAETLAGRGLKSWHVTLNDIEGNNTVKAGFDSWEVAKQIHDSLAGKRLPYLGDCTLRLWLPQPLQYIISIPVQQYQSQKRIWDSLAEGATNKAAYIRTFTVQNRVTIKVLGEDRKAVGSLKVRVEGLAGGEQLDATFWHRSFMQHGGSQFLASLYGRTGAYVCADWRMCVVKVYGDPTSVERARDAVKSEVERLDSLQWPVFLKRQYIRFFVRQGLATLKEALGDDNATLDISSGACKIVIRGGEDARHMLKRLMDEAEEEAVDLPRINADNACPICYDEISHPVTLGCRHTYCMACLSHFLTTAVDTKLFPLKCMGNEATCGIPIPLPTIEKFLPTPQFHRLLDVAFQRYVEEHPREFKYCKTPDCSQVYRCNVDGTAMTCPSCFLSICSSCDDEAHEGMSCAERRLQSDPGEQERRNEEWATTNGVKRCPTCSVWIEKTEGCNHMACKCGAHICWICLRVFDREEIYQHLDSAHGGAFVVPPEEPAPARPLHFQNVYGNVQNIYEVEAQQAADRQQRNLDQIARDQQDALRREALHQLAFRRQMMLDYEEQRRRAAAEAAERDRREALRELALRRQDYEEQRRRAAAAAAERDRGWGCVLM